MEKFNKTSDDNLNRELSELAAKYNKEIDMLTRRLDETQRSLDDANRTTFDMQENLKKAFMRGVCALNFEAMSIIGTKRDDNASDAFSNAEQIAQNMFSNTKTSFLNYAPPTITGTERDAYPEPETLQNSPKKNIVFYQTPKVNFY
jgi:hypothetical protein